MLWCCAQVVALHVIQLTCRATSATQTTWTRRECVKLFLPSDSLLAKNHLNRWRPAASGDKWEHRRRACDPRVGPPAALGRRRRPSHDRRPAPLRPTRMPFRQQQFANKFSPPSSFFPLGRKRKLGRFSSRPQNGGLAARRPCLATSAGSWLRASKKPNRRGHNVLPPVAGAARADSSNLYLAAHFTPFACKFGLEAPFVVPLLSRATGHQVRVRRACRAQRR